MDGADRNVHAMRARERDVDLSGRTSNAVAVRICGDCSEIFAVLPMLRRWALFEATVCGAARI